MCACAEGSTRRKRHNSCHTLITPVCGSALSEEASCFVHVCTRALSCPWLPLAHFTPAFISYSLFGRALALSPTRTGVLRKVVPGEDGVGGDSKGGEFGHGGASLSKDGLWMAACALKKDRAGKCFLFHRPSLSSSSEAFSLSQTLVASDAEDDDGFGEGCVYEHALSVRVACIACMHVCLESNLYRGIYVCTPPLLVQCIEGCDPYAIANRACSRFQSHTHMRSHVYAHTHPYMSAQGDVSCQGRPACSSVCSVQEQRQRRVLRVHAR